MHEWWVTTAFFSSLLHDYLMVYLVEAEYFLRSTNFIFHYVMSICVSLLKF